MGSAQHYHWCNCAISKYIFLFPTHIMDRTYRHKFKITQHNSCIPFYRSHTDRPTAIQSTDPISCVQRKVEIFVTERKIPFVSRYWIFGQTELGCAATRKKYQLFFNWTNTMFLAQLLWSDKSLLAGRPNGHCTFTYWNLVLVALWSGARTQPLLTSHYKPSYAETRVARLASPVWANNFILVR